MRAPTRLNPVLPRSQMPDPVGMAFGYQQLIGLIKELTDLRDKHIAEHKAALQKIDKAHEDKMAQLDTKIQRLHDYAHKIQKGDPGTPAPVVDEKAMEDRIYSRIRQPKDGNTPVVDLEALAKEAAKLIKIPDIPKPIDETVLTDSVIEKITKGKKLKAEHISDTETHMESYLKRYGYKPYIHGGGVPSLTAGSNITLTAKSDGGFTIASSGGSGFTTLTATETPNGSTTVFTFAAASAQPSYLVVDNVWLKATAASGTVNWTWNNGTKKATLTIPPNDDIWGVV